jgi:hypothetical protein
MNWDLIRDSQWEIWGLPWDEDEMVSRFTRLFEMHPRDIMSNSKVGRGPEYIERIAELGQPVYFQARAEWPECKTGMTYPLPEVVAELGRDYFGSSIAYMVALACFERAERIMLWGVHLLDPIYDHQRPNLEYLLGHCEARGITVEIVEPSQLLVHRKVDRLGKLPMRYPTRYGWTI